MATARNERYPVTWDDLQAAVNPPPKPEEPEDGDVWEAIDEVTDALQQGQITAAEAQGLIRELLASNVDYDLRGMIADALSAPGRERPVNTQRRWRFVPAERGRHAQ